MKQPRCVVEDLKKRQVVFVLGSTKLTRMLLVVVPLDEGTSLPAAAVPLLRDIHLSITFRAPNVICACIFVHQSRESNCAPSRGWPNESRIGYVSQCLS